MHNISPLVLTFVNHRMPELARTPEKNDPQGATLDLWLKYEEERKYRWRGRVAMDDSRQVDALNSIRDSGPVTLRLKADAIPFGDTEDSKGTDKNAELIIQVGNHRWALPGKLWKVGVPAPSPSNPGPAAPRTGIAAPSPSTQSARDQPQEA